MPRRSPTPCTYELLREHLRVYGVGAPLFPNVSFGRHGKLSVPNALTPITGSQLNKLLELALPDAGAPEWAFDRAGKGKRRLVTSYGFRHGAVTSLLRTTGLGGIPVAAALVGNKPESMGPYAETYYRERVARSALERAGTARR